MEQWNLTNIYPAPDSKEFEADLAKLSSRMKELSSRIEKKTADLAWLIDTMNEIRDLYETMESYTECLTTANTTDKTAVNALNRLEELGMERAAANTRFTAYVAEHGEEAENYAALHPEYAFVLKEAAEDAAHRMDLEKEELAADLMRSGSDSFRRLQQAVSSSACAEFDGEKKTVIELRAMAGNKDREIRRKAYEAELRVWKEHEIAFAYSLNSIKGTCLSLEKRRNWPDPLTRSCADSRITKKTLDALITTLEGSLPMFRRYLKTKAKLLGLEKLAFFDLFAPVGNCDMTYTFEEAKDFVIRQYTAFDPDMGAFARNAFAAGWVDPFPRNKKTGGAYDIYFPKVKESRVFANFDGTYDGVSTFAHELGHAWHDRIVSDKPAMLRTYPMTLAETASIFSEFIAFKGAMQTAGKEEQKALIEMFLLNACQVCVDILCRFYFEREVFEKRKEGELMAEDLCAIMLDCQKRTYGDGLDENFLHPYMWAVKCHYYSTGFSFYNYPYAFGQLFALGLYSRSEKAGGETPFKEKYKELLSKTGYLPAEEVAASAGIDIEDPAFWEEGMEIIARYEKELEKLAE